MHDVQPDDPLDAQLLRRMPLHDLASRVLDHPVPISRIEPYPDFLLGITPADPVVAVVQRDLPRRVDMAPPEPAGQELIHSRQLPQRHLVLGAVGPGRLRQAGKRLRSAPPPNRRIVLQLDPAGPFQPDGQLRAIRAGRRLDPLLDHALVAFHHAVLLRAAGPVFASGIRFASLRLGYAATVHRAQGMTLEQDAYVLLGGSMQSKEMTYVQLSRARGETHLFSDVRDSMELERLVRRSEEKRSAHGVASERGWIEKDLGQKESQEQAQGLGLAM